MSKRKGWIGVDLDGTLAHYEGWRGKSGEIGEPIRGMQDRVAKWLCEGQDVRIVTARVDPRQSTEEQREQRRQIEVWCKRHFGIALPIQCHKDFDMIELWDDRAVQVIKNSGRSVMEYVLDQAKEQCVLFRDGIDCCCSCCGLVARLFQPVIHSEHVQPDPGQAVSADSGQSVRSR